MKKRIISIILILCMVMTFVPTTVFAAEGITPETPQKDSNGVYQIGTAAELYGFAELVNNGNTTANAVLTADIVVNTGVLKADGSLADDVSNFTSWTPIGNSYSNRYTGKFDGQGHTISGLYFNKPSATHVGLFGYLESGEIKNVGVIDSCFRGKNGVGGVCGYSYSGTITGCYNTGTVSGDWPVGGVCGDSFGTITGCYNTGKVSGNEYVGGVSGRNESGTITGCYNTGTVSGCYNGGVNEATIDVNVGGVCGVNDNGKITGCYNTGTVIGEYIFFIGADNKVNIDVGGVCGCNSGTITGCYNTGKVSDKVSVTGTGAVNIKVGGVRGENYYGTVTDCAEYNETESENKFKDGTVCTLLNTALINANSDVRFYQGENSPELFVIVDGVYQIYSAEELYGFVQLVKVGNAGITSKLMDDINLSSTLDLSGKNITIDLNGYVISGADILIDTGIGNASFTLTDSNPTATHTDSTLPLGGVVTSTISMKQDGGSFHDCILYGNGGTVTSEFTTNTNAVAIKCTSNSPTAFTGKILGYAHLYGGIYYNTIESIVTIHEKKVTFKCGDKDYAYEIVASGNNVVAPIAPQSKDKNQTFDGWYNGDTEYTFGSPLSDNITLTAVFSAPIPEGLEYTINQNEVTVTGYTGSESTIVIPGVIKNKPVTTIGEKAFISCTRLESIFLPDNILSIGDKAFFDTTSQVKYSLDTEKGQATITGLTLGKYKFSFVMPNAICGYSLTSIGREAFLDCEDLRSIVISDSVTSIKQGAFSGCRNLTDITISESVTAIEDNTFYGCESLTSIDIPNSVQTIGYSAFLGCSNLKSIEIPYSVSTIGNSAFYGCRSLERIFLPDNSLSVGDNAISDETSQVKYSLDTDKGEITITEIKLGKEKTSVNIPDMICGYPVVAVAKDSQENVGNHTCKGGIATCKDKATCDICGKLYGELDNTKHNLENIPAKNATVTEEGNIEHWHCIDCGKYFSDKDGKNTIELKDTVIAKLPSENEQSVSEVTDTISNTDTDNGDIKGSKFAPLKVTATSSKNKTVNLTWSKVSGAKGYIVYGAMCGKTMKKIKTTTGKSYTVKNLKNGKYYKYMVVAYKTVEGKQVTTSISKVTHVAVKGGKFGNPTEITVNNIKPIMSGKKITLKATVESNQKVENHLPLRYESTDNKIAKVSSKGVITAKAKGVCNVYVYAQNGVYKKIKVTVK